MTPFTPPSDSDQPRPPLDPDLAFVLFKRDELVALLKAAKYVYQHAAEKDAEVWDALTDVIDNCESVLRRKGWQ